MKEHSKGSSVHIMKKFGIRIGVLTIAFFMLFLAVASRTKAETRERLKKDLISELHLESANLPAPKSYSVNGKDLRSNPLRGFLIPVKEGLYAFIDCAAPLHQDGLTPKDAGTNYRAVIGLHFSLR